MASSHPIRWSSASGARSRRRHARRAGSPRPTGAGWTWRASSSVLSPGSLRRGPRLRIERSLRSVPLGGKQRDGSRHSEQKGCLRGGRRRAATCPAALGLQGSLRAVRPREIRTLRFHRRRQRRLRPKRPEVVGASARGTPPPARGSGSLGNRRGYPAGGGCPAGSMSGSSGLSHLTSLSARSNRTSVSCRRT